MRGDCNSDAVPPGPCGTGPGPPVLREGKEHHGLDRQTDRQIGRGTDRRAEGKEGGREEGGMKHREAGRLRAGRTTNQKYSLLAVQFEWLAR